MKQNKQEVIQEQAKRFVERYFHLHRDDIISRAKLQNVPEKVIRQIHVLLDNRSRQRTQIDPGPRTTLKNTVFESFTIDSYQITDLLAEGGMSVVYRAHKLDSQAQKDVAIKLIPPHLVTSKLRRLFIDELETLSYLHHPHIVDLHHGGVSDQGIPYFVMELVHEAQTITEHAVNNHLSQQAIIDLFITLAKTLDYAHKNHIIHRDLKPNNILVDGFSHLKVVDFGIAAIARQTAETQAYTQAYSPPEQIKDSGTPVSFATDVYGYCSVLLECLCPDNTDFRPGWQRRCLKHSPLDRDLKKIIDKGLQFLPQDRYPNFDALVTDLSLWQQHLPLASFNNTLWDNTSKFFRRQPFAGSLLILGFVLLSAGLAFTFWQIDRLQNQTAKTDQVRTLFFNAIEQTDPDIRQGQSITVQSMLHQALRSIQENPIKDPQLAFEFNHLLGTALLKAGDYDNAIGQLKQAQSINPGDINNNLVLAEAHLKQQSFKQADIILQRISPADLNNRADNLFIFHELKGQLADFDADFKQAEKHYKLARQYAEKLNQPLLLTRIIEEQANSLNLQDLNQEALNQLNQGIEQARRLWGENHSGTLGLRMALIEIQQSLSIDDIKDSIEELEDIIPRLEQFYQADHPVVAKMRLFQSSANLALGHVHLAEQQAKKALSIAETSLDKNSALFARINMAMARVMLAKKNNEQALKYARSAVNGFHRVYGESHNETLQHKTSLAAILLQQEHFAEARDMARDIYQQQTKVLGEDHRASQYAQMVLARAHMGLGNFEQAENHAANCRRNAVRVDATSILAVGCGLALEHSLFEQQKWDRAKVLAEELLANPIVSNHPVYSPTLKQHVLTINAQ